MSVDVTGQCQLLRKKLVVGVLNRRRAFWMLVGWEAGWGMHRCVCTGRARKERAQVLGFPFLPGVGVSSMSISGSATCVDIIEFAFPDCGVGEAGPRARATGMLCDTLCDMGRGCAAFADPARKYCKMNGSGGHEALVFLGVCSLYQEPNHVNRFA
jgi:hypothetical protein